jgi:hypothetical protein
LIDEARYRDTYRSVNERPCPFEKAILTNRCGCELSQRILLAEREAASCAHADARARCVELLEYLRDKARFALKETRIGGPLPHGKEIKVQVGGMLGLQELVGAAAQGSATVDNVHAVLDAAVSRYGSIQHIPYQELVRHVLNYQHRRRRG